MSLFEILDNKHEKLSGFYDLYSVYTENIYASKNLQNYISTVQLSAVQLAKKILISNLYYNFSYSNPST